MDHEILNVSLFCSTDWLHPVRSEKGIIPNSSHPTGGRLLLLPADQVHEINMSVRRGMRLVVTTGMGEVNGSQDLPLVRPRRV